MTAPLTPPDLDLRDFDWMPLQVVRLRDSGIVVVASAEAFRAAVLLWCAAWHQVPAASLPKDEKMLCSLAGFGRDVKMWRTLADDALHGFVECADGRLYHPVIAEKAIEAGSKKKKQTSQTAAATEARRLAKAQRDEAVAEAERQRNVNVTSNVGPPKTGRNVVQGRGEDQTLPDQTRQEHTDSGRDFFEEFWKEYPRRDGDNPKLPAKMKFDSLVKTGIDPEIIIAGVKRYAAKALEKQQVGTQYIAHALKWLSEQRWADIAAATFIAADRTADPQPQDWQAAVKRWLANESHWPRWAGPEPTSPACRCPAEVLIAAGIDPESGWLVSRLYKIVSGTEEMAALIQSRQSRHIKPPRVYQIEVDGREQTVCWAKTQWPADYNDFGERVSPNSDEAAA